MQGSLRWQIVMMRCSPVEFIEIRWEQRVIYNEILNNRGTQFDPEIADVF